MDPFASPPLVVEAGLRSAGITWTPTDNGREGVFHAERCPLCLNGGTLVMQWLGEARSCSSAPTGTRTPMSVEAFGIDPDGDAAYPAGSANDPPLPGSRRQN